MTYQGVELTKDKNIAIARTGELWLTAVGNERITDVSWQEYLEMAKASVAKHGPFTGLYLLYPKNGPSTAQRSMLTADYGQAVRIDMQRRVALITSSAVTRGAITAIGWFTKGATSVRAFSPSAPDRNKALDWLGEEIRFDRGTADVLEQELSSAVRVLLAG